jgi:hypothetical protein
MSLKKEIRLNPKSTQNQAFLHLTPNPLKKKELLWPVTETKKT